MSSNQVSAVDSDDTEAMHVHQSPLRHAGGDVSTEAPQGVGGSDSIDPMDETRWC